METTSRQYFDAGIKPLKHALYHLALSIVGATNADDALQNALLKAWERTEAAAWQQFAQYRGSKEKDGGEGSALFLFLVPFLRAACHDLIRRSALMQRRELPLSTVLSMAVEGSPIDMDGDLWHACRLEMYRLLLRVTLTGLQEMCIRDWCEGYSQADIAAYLGIRQTTVSHHISAGCRRLTDAYALDRNETIEARRAFDEIARDGAASVYHRPVGVWDRRGTAREIERRRWVRN